jgi:GxxExxY protein
MQVETQVPVPVSYKGELVGDYYVDIVVEGKLIVELKCCDQFADEHTAQCLNYLKATGRTIMLLVNFQRPKAEWKRIVLGH